MNFWRSNRKPSGFEKKTCHLLSSIGRAEKIGLKNNDFMIHSFYSHSSQTPFKVLKNDSVWFICSTNFEKNVTNGTGNCATGPNYNITEKWSLEISGLFNTVISKTRESIRENGNLWKEISRHYPYEQVLFQEYILKSSRSNIGPYEFNANVCFISKRYIPAYSCPHM